MLALTLKLFLFLSVGFAAASPVMLSAEQTSKSYGSVRSDPLVSDASRTIEILDAVPSGTGNQLFASGQWKKRTPTAESLDAPTLFAHDQWKKGMIDTPTKIRESRDPQTTIFNHMQWDECVFVPGEEIEAKDVLRITATRIIKLLDLLSLLHYLRTTSGKKCMLKVSPLFFRSKLCSGVQLATPRRMLWIFRNSNHFASVFNPIRFFRKRSRESGSEVGSFRKVEPNELEERKDISTGPVFFAKVQWDE
ncbi:hypothetical protein B0H17DRAFT_1059326 [Mycena rosella]|uniref:Uncharacterized protein n=1 Tax=Mycena rosella TaxID=1033263 RepID=A0AAD7DKV0_MYCRO|nr:hypothetical protein B0H17DRAFT_1059326 [Mycena rosella]